MNRGPWHSTADREQDLTQEKVMQKSKIAVWGSLKNSCEKKRSQKQRRKEKIYPFEWEFQRIARRDKKAFLSDQCKEIEENNRMGNLEISSRKLEVLKIKNFKRTCTVTVVFSAADPEAGCCWSTPLLETHGHSQASLVQSLFLLAPGAHKVLFIPPKSLFPQTCGNSVV